MVWARFCVITVAHSNNVKVGRLLLELGEIDKRGCRGMSTVGDICIRIWGERKKSGTGMQSGLECRSGVLFCFASELEGVCSDD
jgi:hypothetical protein